MKSSIKAVNAAPLRREKKQNEHGANKTVSNADYGDLKEGVGDEGKAATRWVDS